MLGSAALAAALLCTPSVGGAQLAKPFAEFSESALTMRDSVVAIARAQVGKKYRMGGATPDRGFDCSGLVRYVLQAMRVDVPRTSREQSRIGAAVPRDTTQLRPGDLLLFGKPKAGVSHVGIYVGNGRYVHASSVAGRVIESPLDRPPSPLIKPLKSARRVIDATESVIAVTTVAARNQ
jgi:cell wall-associated NlpC family hydrolase